MRNNTAVLLRENTVNLDHREAVPRPTTFDAEALTIEAVIASTSPVRRRDQRGEFWEILDPAGLDLETTRGASVIDSHRQGGIENVIGALDDVWIDGEEVVARVRFSARPEVQPIIADVGSGIIRFLSVGYEVSEWRDGTNAQGQRTKTAIKWAAREASFVSVPADARARTRSGRADINRTIRTLGRHAGVPLTVVDDLINRGATVEDAKMTLLFDMMTRGAVPIRSGGRHNAESLDNPEVFQRAAADALYTRVLPSFTPPPQARQYIGQSCAELARECLIRSGGNITGMSAPTLVTRALETTSDYPAIMANVMNKSLRDAYAAVPTGIRQIARETTANDFRSKARVQLDHSGFTLEKVTEAGEFRHGGFIDTAESYKVDTYGKIWTVSRQLLVNDNLGALTDAPRRQGMAAAEFERQFLVDLLTANAGMGPVMSDGKTTFHADHGNERGSVSGDGAPPSEGTLSTARLAMRDQTGPGGGLISIVPRFLVVPSELETMAEKLITSIQATQIADVNVFAFIDLIVEPRLTDPARWYIAASPTLIDGLEFAYLAGAPGPQTEARAGFEVDGMQYKVRLDYGAGIVEWRGLYTNAGR